MVLQIFAGKMSFANEPMWNMLGIYSPDGTRDLVGRQEFEARRDLVEHRPPRGKVLIQFLHCGSINMLWSQRWVDPAKSAFRM